MPLQSSLYIACHFVFTNLAITDLFTPVGIIDLMIGGIYTIAVAIYDEGAVA